MRFFDLPEKLNVGGAHLTPVSHCGTLKQYTCSWCDRLSQSVLKCGKKHTLCKQCCIPGFWPNKQGWCPLCKQPFSPKEVRCDVLEKVKFQCACGFKGKLATMKGHLLNGPASVRKVCGGIFGKTPSVQTTDAMVDYLENRLRSLVAEKMIDIKHSLIEEVNKQMEIQKINLGSAIPQPLSVDTGTGSKLAQLEQTLSTVTNTLERFRQNRAYLWFNLEDLSRNFGKRREETRSPIQFAVVAGVHLQVYICIAKQEAEESMGILLKLVRGSKQATPVPLNRKFTVAIHDEKGAEVSSCSFNSLEEGKYIADCGPTPDETSPYYKCPKMITMKSVRQQKCLVGEMICVSVGIGPME